MHERMVCRVTAIGDGRAPRGTPNADEAYAEAESPGEVPGYARTVTIGPEMGPSNVFVREDVGRLLDPFDSTEAGGREVPCDGNRSVCCGVTVKAHTCPYAEEINEDYESLCNCCAMCERECLDDI